MSVCEKCGGPLAEGALSGRCPRCLLEAGLQSEPDFQRTMTVAPTAPGSAQPIQPGEDRMPVSIARYRIVRLIGEGGMGAVYEAEQDQPRRTVALKIIKPGMASPNLLRRFEQEAQALGRLQHPGIAQIYEAGTADTGFGPQPYFAMEFIRGSSLKDYCEEKHLNTRDRLEMMAKVSDAVHHAHQRGLIHRDLKPANILVDETGQPKILDFGVARVTDRDAQATSSTDVGQLIGTLAYMSPEQVLADPLELDTRSDVYALGVILYELLAARLPYNIGNKLHEALTAIRETDPSRLSSVSHGYKGDIETIVAKALEKDKTRRYSSAADLAADIRRYLTDQPIEARPPSLNYQLQKFARRHKAVVAGVAAVFVVLVGGIVASTLEAARANREMNRATAAERSAMQARDQAMSAEQKATQARDQAVEQKQRADTEAASEVAVSAFWQQNLVAQAKDGDLSMRAALDQAAAKIKSDDKQPLVEAKVRESVAKSYMVLSALAPAQEQLERALAIRRRVQGDEHPDTLDTNLSLAVTYIDLGRKTEGESLLNRTIETRRRVQGPEHPDTLKTLFAAGQVLATSSQFAKAEPLLKEVFQGRRRVLGPEHRDTIGALMVLGASYLGQEKFELARQSFQTVFEVSSRTLSETDTLRVGSGTMLKTVETMHRFKGQQTEPTKAEIASFMSESSKVLPSDFRSMTDMLVKTPMEAQALVVGGKFEQAVGLLNGRLEIARRAGIENTQEASVLWRLLGRSYAELKKFPEAESNFLKSLDIYRKTLGPEDALVLGVMRGLVTQVYMNAGKFSEAEALLVKLVEIERRTSREGNPATLGDTDLLAQVYADQGKYAQAEELYTQLLDVQRRTGSEALRTAVSLSSIGWVRLQQKRYAEAETVLREAANSLQTAAPVPWEKSNMDSMLGASLAGQKKYADAEPLLLAGFDGMNQRQPTASTTSRFTLEQAGEAVVMLYQDWGEPEKVAEWKSKLQASKAAANR